jgi:cell division protein FtsQ
VTINWKKSAIVLADLLLAVYLLLAVTAFNCPDESINMCREVNIHIEDGSVKGFLDKEEIKVLLQRARCYPVGDQMDHVDVRVIEEQLKKNPFVKDAQCFKTQTGHVNIVIDQRLPVIRVKADNGDDYYVDEHGNIMPNTHFASNLVVATGSIRQKYAQKVLRDIGCFLLNSPLWGNQVEQLNVLPDGSLEMVPRVGDHIVYLGSPSNLERKLERLEKFYKYGLSKAGWNKYSYINVEFDNQIICKKRKN